MELNYGEKTKDHTVLLQAKKYSRTKQRPRRYPLDTTEASEAMAYKQGETLHTCTVHISIPKYRGSNLRSELLEPVYQRHLRWPKLSSKSPTFENNALGPISYSQFSLFTKQAFIVSISLFLESFWIQWISIEFNGSSPALSTWIPNVGKLTVPLLPLVLYSQTRAADASGFCCQHENIFSLQIISKEPWL